jgi:hypothetical protein
MRRLGAGKQEKEDKGKGQERKGDGERSKRENKVVDGIHFGFWIPAAAVLPSRTVERTAKSP